MLSTLNQFLSVKKEAALRDRSEKSSRYDIIGRLYFLLDKLAEEQKLILLQQLLGDKTVDHILKLIVDLPDNQRLVLMKQLEEITSRAPNADKRKYVRKDCLINARISIANRVSDCFILDINAYGAFVDSSEGLSGQSSKLVFFLPHTRNRIILSGEVVWSDSHGSGIKFNRLTPKQREDIQLFTSNKPRVYEITS
ncbi:MAG: PilZ domain-containing protein [Desulfobacterales bacterium]|jgi:hypothetical protein